MQHGSHPDLTWVAPSGAHEMLRRDVDEAVVRAAAHTPFEARHRVFVLERADTMNDEAANALLKTLEEPPAYVVLLLLTDRPDAGAADDRLALPARALRPAAGGGSSPSACRRAASSPRPPTACARLALGDGERALALAAGDGAGAARAAEAFARAPLHGRAGAERPWRPLLEARAARAAAAARGRSRPRSPRSSQFLPEKEHSRRETEFTERARRAERRARDRRRSTTRSSSPASGTATSPAWPPARPSSPTTPTAPTRSPQDAAGRDAAALREAVELVDDTRARLALNVSEELALRGARLPARAAAGVELRRASGALLDGPPRAAAGSAGPSPSSVAATTRATTRLRNHLWSAGRRTRAPTACWSLSASS